MQHLPSGRKSFVTAETWAFSTLEKIKSTDETSALADADSVKKEFENYGLIEFLDIDEPIKYMENKPPLKCIIVRCKKND